MSDHAATVRRMEELDAEIVPLGRAEWRLVGDPTALLGGDRVRLRYDSGVLAGTVVVGDLISVGTDTIRLHSGTHYTDVIMPRPDDPDVLFIERLTRLN